MERHQSDVSTKSIFQGSLDGTRRRRGEFAFARNGIVDLSNALYKEMFVAVQVEITSVLSLAATVARDKLLAKVAKADLAFSLGKSGTGRRPSTVQRVAALGPFNCSAIVANFSSLTALRTSARCRSLETCKTLASCRRSFCLSVVRGP